MSGDSEETRPLLRLLSPDDAPLPSPASSPDPGTPGAPAGTVADPQTCDVRGCGLPAHVLLANDARFDTIEYQEWYACRWHKRNPSIDPEALALPVCDTGDMGA